MKRFRKNLLALSAGGVVCSSNAFIGGLGGVSYAAIWTQVLSYLLSIIVTLFFGGDTTQLLQTQ